MSDKYHAAGVLVKKFPGKAIEALANQVEPDAVKNHIEAACGAEGKNYYSVMQGDEDTRTSTLPYHGSSPSSTGHARQTSFDNPNLPLSPPPSSQASSRANSDQEMDILAYSTDKKWKPLNMRRASRSHNLICADIAERLRLDLETLEEPIRILYHEEPLWASERVELTWKRGADAKRTHEGFFYIVSTLEDADIILGELKCEDGLSRSIDGVFCQIGLLERSRR